MKLILTDELIKKKLSGLNIDLESYPNIDLVDSCQSLDKRVPQNSILITHEGSPQNYIENILDCPVNHIISVQHIDIQRALQISMNMITNPQEFINDPLKVLLHDQGSFQWSHKFQNSFEKKNVLEVLESKVSALKLRKQIQDTVLLLADELFTNAIYNAPVGHLDVKLPRTEPVCLSDGHFGKLFFAREDERIILGCEDNFGSLDIQNFLKRILYVFKTGRGLALHHGGGGAGIGCHIMYDLSTELYLGVQKGLKTVVCLGLTYKNSKDKNSTYKSVHRVVI